MLQQEQVKLQQKREQREHERAMVELKSRHERESVDLKIRRLQLEREWNEIHSGMGKYEPKIPKFEERGGGNIDVYLKTFEMVVASNDITQSKWAVKLAPKTHWSSA